MLLARLGFHRVHILSLLCRDRSRWRAAVYRSSVIPCIYGELFRHRGAPVSAAAPTCGHGRGLASRTGCAGPGEGIDSLRLRLRSSMPGERGRRDNPKVPALSCRRQPPRRVPPRNASRLVAAYRLLLPGKQPPRPRGGHGSCPGNGRQVTANTGSRPSRRVLTRGHALRACPLFAPFPPRPPSPMRCRAPISGRNVWESRGLRSLPAVFAGARPARSHSLALTAVDCFPEPLHRGAAVLIGDTPRRTGAFRWLPISFGK